MATGPGPRSSELSLSEEDARRLQAMCTRLAPNLTAAAEAIVERAVTIPAYGQLTASRDEPRRALVERTEAWCRSMLSASKDPAYFAQRAAVGHLFASVGFPVSAIIEMSRIVREELTLRLDHMEGRSAAERSADLSAFLRVLEIDLGLVLEPFRADLLGQAHRAERLVTFGLVVGTIAHELRNPLAVMETSLYLLREELPAPSPSVLKSLDRLQRQMRLSGEIITRLLRLVQDQPTELHPVDLGRVVREVLVDLPPPKGVTLEHAGATVRCAVLGDEVQLREVVLNLVSNAYEAVGEAGTVRVRVNAAPTGTSFSIEDTGPGISPAVRPRLFEPLVTTKPAGTGLGLALVKRVVDRHAATIAVDSGELGGARFTVSFRPVTA